MDARRDNESDPPRPLEEHLLELRRRVLWSAGAALLFSIPAWFLTDLLISHLARRAGPLVFLAPAEAFTARLRLAAMLGLFLAAPVGLYHAWRFAAVALTRGERRASLAALPASWVLFASGAALGWFAVVPAGLRVLLSFGGEQLRPQLSVEACVRFALWTCAGLGILFQLPVVSGALARWGMVSAATLSRHRRHAAVAILILAGVLTPGPDVLSQLLLAVPAYLVYEVSIVTAAVLRPRSC